MKIKDKALISYFGTKNVDESTFDKLGNKLTLDFSTNLDELFSVINAFPGKVNTININATNIKYIEEIVSRVPYGIFINLDGITKDTFEKLPPEIGVRISRLTFQGRDKAVETINIGEIAQKFPNASSINFPAAITPGVNLSNLSQITYLIQRSQSIDLDPELISEYTEYLSNNPNTLYSDIVVGSRSIYNKTRFDSYNQSSEEACYYPGCELKNAGDISEYISASQGKIMILYANNMSDVPLELAERLQAAGVQCKIRMDSYDNASYQNEDYSLDEYVQIARQMDELIGDIDENLPEEEKFKLIYERITKYLVYDYPAAYPKTKEEKKYSQENVKNCRNLRNGLLQGKTVCAGYADILKNACLMKGIECEYIQGPVDFLKNRDAFLDQKKEDREECVYIDEQSAITRGYHAWNKVRINGQWYNCDPTWDRNDIVDGRGPKYALLSDDTYKKLGRPTTAVYRHACTTDVKYADRKRIFDDLEPCGNLIAHNKIIDFENSVDEYGRPRQLPVIPKVFPWTKLMRNLRKFAKTSREKAQSMIYNLKRKLNPDFDKTEELDDTLEITEELQTVDETTEKIETVHTEQLETVEKEDTEKTEQLEIVGDKIERKEETEEKLEDFDFDKTEPLPVLGDTEPLPTVSENEIPENKLFKEDKKPSWELSQDELNAVREVEQKKATKETINRENNDRENEGNEIGE